MTEQRTQTKAFGLLKIESQFVRLCIWCASAVRVLCSEVRVKHFSDDLLFGHSLGTYYWFAIWFQYKYIHSRLEANEKVLNREILNSFKVWLSIVKAVKDGYATVTDCWLWWWAEWTDWAEWADSCCLMGRFALISSLQAICLPTHT